jgi:hypothetical protein
MMILCVVALSLSLSLSLSPSSLLPAMHEPNQPRKPHAGARAGGVVVLPPG